MTAHLLQHVNDVATALLALDPPDPDPVAPPGLAEFAGTILSWLKWIAIVCGVGGFIFCGVQMIVGQRGRHAMAADGAAGVPWVIAGLSMVIFAAGLVGAITGF
jgi:hypothetical protein